MSTVVCPVVLEGRLVRLEPLSLDHASALLDAATRDRSTFDLTTVPDTPEDMRAYIEEALRWQEEGHAIPFATIDRATGQVVGTTRFADIQYWRWSAGSPNDRGGQYPDGLEIGWTWLTPAAQRSGINTEAKLLQLAHAFEQWRVRRVLLKTDARNMRSRNAIERLGAKFDGILRAHLPASDGMIRDSAYYSILDSEWDVVKANLERLLVR
jgi:RimJ/RimL family protein N-acetyltransferase